MRKPISISERIGYRDIVGKQLAKGAAVGGKTLEREVDAARAEKEFLAFKDYASGSMDERTSWILLSAGYADTGFGVEAKLAHEMATHAAGVERLDGHTLSFFAAEKLLEWHRAPDASRAGAAKPASVEDRVAEVVGVFRIANMAAAKMLVQAEGYSGNKSCVLQNLGVQLRHESALLAKDIERWMELQELDVHGRMEGSAHHRADILPRVE